MGDREGSRVLGVQRARLIAAVTEVAYERGAKQVTVSEIVRQARISRRSFYDLFANADECLLAALEDALARARGRVLSAQREVRGGWRARARAGLTALLELFDESPQVAHLLVVESLRACPEALRLREQAIGEIASALQHPQLSGGCSRPPELVGEALVGAGLSILHSRLLHDAQRRRDGAQAASAPHRSAGEGEAGAGVGPDPSVGRLIELTGPLMGIFVLPHLGVAAARREMTQAQAPARSRDRAPGMLDAGTPLGIRLTNRTILVLNTIAKLSDERPGPSNRQVAMAAGIGDQGQASKLLARLCRHGLIQNVGSSARHQLRVNEWRLTARGEALARSLAGVA